MKTAIEPPIPAWTTDELTHRLEHGYPSVERLAAAAMLRTQAAEIESLRKMLVISDDTHQTWMKANAPGGWIDELRKENEALKADAMKQEAKIKVLTDALEQIKHSITQMQLPGNDKRREVLLIQNTVAEALTLAKEAT